MKYHYFTVDVVMRDCDNLEQAKRLLEYQLPYKPDENTKHMESWYISNGVDPQENKVENYDD